jgi:hypothetical protein
MYKNLYNMTKTDGRHMVLLHAAKLRDAAYTPSRPLRVNLLHRSTLTFKPFPFPIVGALSAAEAAAPYATTSKQTQAKCHIHQYRAGAGLPGPPEVDFAQLCGA